MEPRRTRGQRVLDSLLCVLGRAAAGAGQQRVLRMADEGHCLSAQSACVCPFLLRQSRDREAGLGSICGGRLAQQGQLGWSGAGDSSSSSESRRQVMGTGI